MKKPDRKVLKKLGRRGLEFTRHNVKKMARKLEEKRKANGT